MGCSSKSGDNGLTVPPDAQPSGAQFTAGRRILSESQHAYANVHSYDGTIEVSATSGYPTRTSSSEQRVFDVRFEAPHKLRMDGEDSNGDPFVIRLDSKSTTIEWNGEVQQFNSAEEAFYGFSGITLDGSLLLPGCLLNIDWDNEASLSVFPQQNSFLDAWATKAQLDGTALIEGAKCHRIVCEREIVTWTIYVDTESSLLRCVNFEVNEEQMRRLNGIGQGGGASGSVISMKRSQIFHIDQVEWKKKPVEDLKH